MTIAGYTPSQIASMGQERYERETRAAVEADNHGKILALDVDTGDYAIAADSLTAFDSLQSRRPDAPIYILRIGYPTVAKIGGGSTFDKQTA